MITFKQKTYSEYDAMKLLYTEIRKRYLNIDIINKSQLLAVLKGNNIVIERFNISTNFLGASKYRAYFRIGSNAKLPDEVRLPDINSNRMLLNLASVSKSSSTSNDDIKKIRDQINSMNNTINDLKSYKSNKTLENKDKKLSSYKLFGDNNSNSNGGGLKFIRQDITRLLGKVKYYDKVTRSLVIEYDSVKDAIDSFEILPFGLNYKIYLLDQ